MHTVALISNDKSVFIPESEPRVSQELHHCLRSGQGGDILNFMKVFPSIHGSDTVIYVATGGTMLELTPENLEEHPWFKERVLGQLSRLGVLPDK